MSSLADLPEIIGFFSYSREDDEAFKGTLSALRDGIQRELSAQLGRSKRTFRLWQDQEAIAPGRLWESEIKTAVEQAVFFIPIVTPRAVNSNYCHFEFEAFLARERALGRTDLVFPILYITVPALENEAQWRDHPVLSTIGKRQYVDWRSFRHLDVQTTAVREAVERFCSKIVEALHRSWMSPEEQRRQEDVEARERAHHERHREEAEARRRAEEAARSRKDEAEAQSLAEERRRQEAEAERRAREVESQRRAEAEARQQAEKTRRSSKVEAKPSRRALVIGGAALGAGALATWAAIMLHPKEPSHQTIGESPATPSSVTPTRTFLLRTLTGHTDTIYALAIAPDGRTALSGSYDKTLRLWDLASGSIIRTLTGHTGRVFSVAIAPDGRTALSGSEDKTLRLWDLTSGSTIRTLTGHTDIVFSVAISPDGRTALSGSNDKTVRLWNLASGSMIRTLTGANEAFSVAIVPDGRTALSGSADKTLRQWDLANGNAIRTFSGHADTVTSVAIAPDGRTALSASYDKTLILWDLASGSTIRTLEGHTGAVEAVAIVPDGRTALSGSADKTLKLWDLA
jgi:TIR domain/WD domain, G-beta repeat